MAKPKLGSGERFKALEGKLAERPGVTNPGALAASIGRKKYGGKKMESMAASGRRRQETKPVSTDRGDFKIKG